MDRKAMCMDLSYKISSAIYGLCIGDCLGVPFEGLPRECASVSVSNMPGYGTYNLPPGSWSDDTSLTLCLADSLCGGINYRDVMDKFVSWLYQGKYTPDCAAFGIGRTTKAAIDAYLAGYRRPLDCGLDDMRSNGNGSLMRCLPAAFYAYANALSREKQFKLAHDISRLTHSHSISRMACGIYVNIAAWIMRHKDESLREALIESTADAVDYYKGDTGYCSELKEYAFLAGLDRLSSCPSSGIMGSAYSPDTLKAAIWCLMTTNCYTECVISAVSLGGDTDTIAAVAGGIAGLYYGRDSIPKAWTSAVRSRNLIDSICMSFARSLK